MPSARPKRIGVMTSGGDAPGMNAAVRSVVRTALDRGAEVYAIENGYAGMIEGGDRIRPLTWDSVGGVLHRGGTVVGTARSAEFRTPEGRLRAARNIVERGIDALVVIGGDGSLSGADLLRAEWRDLLSELVNRGDLAWEVFDQHPNLFIVGLVGSIDNDMAGVGITIGADTALHRITAAIDALVSTAASHQRTSVVEVMGRGCGYLALMSALATGAQWILIPEDPPEEGWEDRMCEVLREGRREGRRHATVVVAEGACDRAGRPISAEYVRGLFEERLSIETRVTVLGHVQRGGSPSAFDRNMATLLGHAAVEEILSADTDAEPCVMGYRANRISRVSLAESVASTRAIGEAVAERRFDEALSMRGAAFGELLRVHRTLVRARPREPKPGQRRLRLAILNAGAPAPGMNTAVRAAVRLSMDEGHTPIAVRDGFKGFAEGKLEEMDWMSVHGWVGTGGAELGTNRTVPDGKGLDAIAAQIEKHRIDAVLTIGGWAGYRAVYDMARGRESRPALRIPMLCVPAAIDNNLPGTELSIGADTALNGIVCAVDRIKQSAVAWNRSFIVEVMGGYCGYLALMSGLATGAERVYLHEEGVTMKDLQDDVTRLKRGFAAGKRVGLLIRNEHASDVYNTDFLRRLFEEEGGDSFDARQAILGHLQQGGDPTPSDRIQATRLTARAVAYFAEQAANQTADASFIGITSGGLHLFDIAELPRLMDSTYSRPREQWWMKLRPIARVLAQPAPSVVEPPA